MDKNKSKNNIAILNKNQNLTIDISKLIETRMLVQSNSGGGKSYLIRKIAEETHGKVQHIILDMEGEFSTLREKYDYLLVGKDGDIPIDIKIAKTLAKRVMELEISVIIDLYELKAHERKIFVKRFLDTLINLPKKLWHPVILILDEGHVFCPEKTKSESAGSVIDMASRGRKRGICLIVATQRISKFNKDAGYFYEFGPAFSKQGKLIKIDPVLTNHPQTGNRVISTTPTPNKHIQNMITQLKDLAEQADKDLITVEDYKKQIRILEFELRKEKNMPKPSIDATKLYEHRQEIYRLKNVYESTHKQNELELIKLNKKLESMQLDYSKIYQIVSKYSNLQQSQQSTIKKDIPIPIPEWNFLEKSKPTNYEATFDEQILNKLRSPKGIIIESNGNLRAGAMKMLQTLAAIHPKEITKVQLATLVGYSYKSGTFSTYLSDLRKNNYMISNGNKFTTTTEGYNYASLEGIPEIKTDPDSILQLWISKFRAGASRMLKIIAERYPNSISKEELGIMAAQYSHTSGTFNTYLSDLRRNGLIKTDTGNTREIIATKELFFEDNNGDN